MRSKSFRIILSVFILFIVMFAWISSMKSSGASAHDSHAVTEFINKILSKVAGGLNVSEHFIRKLAHFAEYLALGVFIMLLYSTYRSPKFEKEAIQSWINCMFIGLCVAVTDETIQSFSGRGSQLKDVCLDFAGFITGTALTFFLWIFVRFLRSQISKKDKNNKNKTV